MSEHDSTKQILYKAGSLPSFKGPNEMFTGDVQVDLLFPPNETAHYSGAKVTFQPGARTAWHKHPAGQHLIVTSGIGITATRDGAVHTFHEGDALWCPADIDHWHGATESQAMTHLALTGDLHGENVEWKDKVTDAEYKQANIDAATVEQAGEN